MKTETRPALLRGMALALGLLPLLAACPQPGPGAAGKNDAAATGGTTSSGGSGGASSAGGATATGGSFASGGGSGSGGTTATGGSSAGGASGGTSGTGGAAGGGGAARTGGRTGSGGMAASGGMTGDGGTVAAGGTAARGGATGSGGVPGSGGVTSATGGGVGSGGTAATGGATGSGGSTACAPPTVNLTGTDAVAGTKITFNDNGGWCWYQDERAIVDVKGNKLVIGSMAFGGSRAAQVEATIYDLATKKGTTAQLGKMSYADDHDAPALILRPDGGYAAMWAGHNNDCYSYYSVYSGSSWAAAKKFDWTSAGCPTSSGKTITYANMWYLGTDLVSFVRSVDTSPNYLLSKDNGSSWTFGGRLTSTPQVGYVAGYYKYWGNNTDRIDFLATESHPRDNDTSLYHGYVKGGKIYNSAGTEIDSTLADTSAKNITSYTQVFKTGSTVGQVKLEHAWNADLVRYDDGNIAAIWTARVTGTGSDDPDKRLLYARYDGTSWKLTYLVKAGPKLYVDEQDYTGLGAVHPDDPNTIYVSTAYDPSTDTLKSGGKREIWRGTTCDNGTTFKWTPVTANSTKDNLRPIVPKWDADHTALLWMQGTYRTAQDMTMAIVGTITGP